MAKFLPLLSVLFFASCGEETEHTQSEARRVTMLDAQPKLDATDEERFLGSPSAAPAAETAPQFTFSDQAPEGWIAQPPTQFRLVNYKFGANGEGEAYLSVVAGGALDNINRWYKQFGQPEITSTTMNQLPETSLFGNRAKIVEASGPFRGMRPGEQKDDWGLLGIVGIYDRQIATVKVLGPPELLQAERGTILAWAATLAAKN